MITAENELPSPTETGALGVCQLKRFWARTLGAREGKHFRDGAEWEHDRIVIDALGLGLEQTMQYLLHEAPSFDAFERWIVERAGRVERSRIARVNAVITGEEYPEETQRLIASIDAMEPVLSEKDLEFWEENGYVVLHEAVSEENRLAAERAIWEHLGMIPDDPESWYTRRNQGIMVQLFQHPAFDANRYSPRIHKAYAQLWGTADLWVCTDRVGFNVPEREGWTFQGPDLHWDISLSRPIHFHLQGILYLTDTPAEQGAFTCVPGFHRRIDAWLDSLPDGADPRRQDLHALGSKGIGGKGGDLIIWRDELPHGSRPNRGMRPRIVQYVRLYPIGIRLSDVWM